uniref:Uncharacterized protein n=1 Tax=Ovis aries TaxID=9940 RepID=A0AC11CA12_SHEEP
MLLAWVRTILVSNMLLAEAYGSGGCFWDNGHLYRADQPSPAPGHRCLNWLDAQSGLAFAPESGAGNHSYCRNPDQDPRGPWCYVSGEAGAPEKRPCEDLRCPDTTSQGLPTSTTETEEAAEVPGGDEVFAPANALPARSEAAAVQPVIGISQRVRVNSKEKKDLGTLGYVLGITMMVIIIIIGAGIVLGYTYKSARVLSVRDSGNLCPCTSLGDRCVICLLSAVSLGTLRQACLPHQVIHQLLASGPLRDGLLPGRFPLMTEPCLIAVLRGC